jgi:hypothetical protein
LNYGSRADPAALREFERQMEDLRTLLHIPGVSAQSPVTA